MSRGTVGKNTLGVYYWYIRYIDRTGNRKQKRCENAKWKTKKDALEDLERFRLSIDDIQDESITVGGLFKIYQEQSHKFLKLRSIDTHDKLFRVHIKPIFENMIVSDLKPKDILRWQDVLKVKNLSNNYLSSIQQFFKTLFLWGVKYEYILKNPFTQEFIKNKNVTQNEMQVWSTDEFNRFILKVDNQIYKAFYTLMYWTGLRKGEAMALTVGDINFNTSQINVNKTWDFINQVTTTPKTKNSIRKVYMTQELSIIIKELVDQHKQSNGFDNDCLIFGYNTHLTQTTISRIKNIACIDSGVRIIRMHDFRHSHVSLLAEMGFTPVEIADRLGHTVDMVNNVYSHLFTGSQKRMADKLEAASKKASEDFSKTLGKA